MDINLLPNDIIENIYNMVVDMRKPKKVLPIVVFDELKYYLELSTLERKVHNFLMKWNHEELIEHITYLITDFDTILTDPQRELIDKVESAEFSRFELAKLCMEWMRDEYTAIPVDEFYDAYMC